MISSINFSGREILNLPTVANIENAKAMYDYTQHV